MNLPNNITVQPSTSAAHHEPSAHLHEPFFTGVRHGVGKIFAFTWWLLTGFGLLGHLFGRKASRSKQEEIVVYCVPRSFFLWAIILVGFVASALVRHYPGTAMLWGWIYIWVLLYTFVTLLFDVSTPKFLLWAGIFTLVWLTSKYLEDVRDWYLLSGVFAHIRSLHPALNAGFASVISWMLLFPWIGGLFHSFSRGRKTFSPNSIEEWFLGEGREILDRSGLKFQSRYRDIFESILGLGAGDLEAVDASHQVVKRWESILFLFFVWNKLDAVLHQRAAVMESAALETNDQPKEVIQSA
jgi:hypothetical protein